MGAGNCEAVVEDEEGDAVNLFIGFRGQLRDELLALLRRFETVPDFFRG